MVSNKGVEPYELILHYSGIQLVNQLMQEDEEFLDLDFAARKQKLVDTAKNLVVNTDTTNLINELAA
jgi:hypothetical protein